MSMDQRAQVLEAVLSAERGTRELIQALGWASSRTINLVRKMEDEGLIVGIESTDTHPSKRARRGRPRKTVACTPLGIEFLESYKKLRMKPLRARKADLAHAARDAEYTARLAAAGHSPFQLFMELNDIASNIKISSEATQSP